MSALALEPARLAPPALPGPYAAPPSPDGLEPHPATVSLVRGVVRALLLDTPGFHDLSPEHRLALAHGLVHVGSYLAECVRDDWYQSERLDQRPMIRTRPAPIETAQATAGQDFQPGAASQVAGVTRETLRAIAFPVFVADLIKGTFNAIQDASQKQMDSYMELLANVSKSVDEFMRDNVSDENARSWLAGRYPRHLNVKDGKLQPLDGRPAGDGPDFTADLDLTESVDVSDQAAIEDTLVPAARRKLAQTRLKMLSTLLLMGINRIVVTGGKIRAAMGFHINTRDQAHDESSQSANVASSASGSVGIGPWSAAASVSVAYVSSTKADSNAELNTQTDLTGEVEIHFQSDYFPIERFADSAGIDKIRANTPVPATNTPTSQIPWGDTSGLKPMEPLGAVRQPSSAPAPTPSPAPATPAKPDAAKKPDAAPAPVKPDLAKKPEATAKPDPTPKPDAKAPAVPPGTPAAPTADASKTSAPANPPAPVNPPTPTPSA
jgi:hypothetical protein